MVIGLDSAAFSNSSEDVKFAENYSPTEKRTTKKINFLKWVLLYGLGILVICVLISFGWYLLRPPIQTVVTNATFIPTASIKFSDSKKFVIEIKQVAKHANQKPAQNQSSMPVPELTPKPIAAHPSVQQVIKQPVVKQTLKLKIKLEPKATPKPTVKQAQKVAQNQTSKPTPKQTPKPVALQPTVQQTSNSSVVQTLKLSIKLSQKEIPKKTTLKPTTKSPVRSYFQIDQAPKEKPPKT